MLRRVLRFAAYICWVDHPRDQSVVKNHNEVSGSADSYRGDDERVQKGEKVFIIVEWGMMEQVVGIA